MNQERSLLDSSGLAILDEIFLAEMNLLQDCMCLRTQLTTALEAGFQNLAKARYIMGKNRVSAAQLPTKADTTNASRTVTSMLPPDSDCYFFNLNVHEQVQSETPPDEPVPSIEDETGEATNKNTCNDPLRWFGILVPQELKRAQDAFQRCVQLSIEVVNLQTKIEHTSQQFWSIIHTASSILYDDEP